ncbi:MAG TPA: hypothetical protein VFV48_00515, partial [Pseudomonadales bacterium]|nr:hypothetical protein [Pseudomonadales bacterium]
ALLVGYDAGSWIKDVLGYVAWALVPYVLMLGLLLATRTNRIGALSDRETAWSCVVIAVAGPLLYFDARFVRPDAQGAIMLMAPILQCVGIGLVSAICLFLRRFNYNKSNRVLSFLNKSALAASFVYLLVSVLQHADEKTIDTAKEIDHFINRHCEARGVLPTSGQIHKRFPGLTTDAGWFFFTDDATWLKMQYPVRWSNSRALGKPQTSEFTATTYSYIVEYRCGGSR